MSHSLMRRLVRLEAAQRASEDGVCSIVLDFGETVSVNGEMILRAEYERRYDVDERQVIVRWIGADEVMP